MSDAKPTTIAPKDLAAELNIDPKRLRGYLRATFPRPAEAKNTTWGITTEAADAARARFTPKADDATVEA